MGHASFTDLCVCFHKQQCRMILGRDFPNMIKEAKQKERCRKYSSFILFIISVLSMHCICTMFSTTLLLSLFLLSEKDIILITGMKLQLS